jgi:hypothetical protein
MNSLLFVVPIMTMISALGMYRLNGRRELFKFDLVQFIYAFIMSPLLFIWLKTVLFLLLRTDLNLRLSINQLFFADTVMSVLFMYVYAFIVIHSLTASFKLKLNKDPISDIFMMSEYFHLWISHIAIYLGTMILTTTLALSNLMYPLPIELTRPQWYLLLTVAFASGGASFATVWLADPNQGHFLRLMKIALAFFSIILLAAYFVWDPPFQAPYVVYWFMLTSFFSSVFFALLANRSPRTRGLLDRLKHKNGWGKNIKLFK